jgi:hypothetical protein
MDGREARLARTELIRSRFREGLMRNLTARAVVDASAAIIRLGERELKRQPLALKLSRVRRVFITEAREIETQRRQLEKEYAVMDDSGGVKEGDIRLSNPYEYQERVKELFDQELCLEFDPISISDFGEKFPWSANVLDPLLFAGVITAADDDGKKTEKKEEDTALADPKSVKTADED